MKEMINRVLLQCPDLVLALP